MSDSGDLRTPKRILILEDNFLLALELESHLADLGHVVAGSFSHLDEARRHVAESSPDLAILDINVRGGSSLPLAVELVRGGVPCLFISGYSAVPEMPAELVGVPRLSKPLQAHELRATLERLTSGVRVRA